MNQSKFPLLATLLLSLSVATSACSLVDSAFGRSAKPIVKISSPPSRSEFFSGQGVPVQSIATDPRGIARVELLVDDVVVLTDPTPTAQGQTIFSITQTWKAIPGEHVIIVRAFNIAGISSDPAGISISVSESQTTIPHPTNAPEPPPSIPPTATSTCTDNASFVADITVPDGTPLAPGQTFNKIWRVRNTGCAWGDGYQLTFTSGDAMTTTRVIAVRKTATGETADLLVAMTAPSSPGIHTGTWRLRNASGTIFGTGVLVKINVFGAPLAGPTKPSAQAACSGTPTIASFIATPALITAGASATLSWGAVTNADSAEIDQGIGGISTPGAATVRPTSTTLYTLTAHCGSASVTAQVTILVPFAIIGAVTSGNPTTFSGACPKTIFFSAAISVNGAGDVAYKWERSDSTATPTTTINFGGAGSQLVTDSWTLGVAGKTYTDYKEHLHILSPNDVTTNDVTFTLSCP